MLFFAPILVKVSLADVEDLDNDQIPTIVTEPDECSLNDRFAKVLLIRPLDYERPLADGLSLYHWLHHGLEFLARQA